MQLFWNLLHWSEKALFGNTVGRIISACVVGYLAFMGWLWFKHDPAVRAKHTVAINKQVSKITTRALNKRNSVDRKNAFKELRRTWCSDC